jgi:DNA-binding MarR family transcriptional regulator
MLVLWETDGITVGEICERLMLDNGTVSPLLKKLQNEGYLEKKRSEKDDRIVIVSLTEKGRELQDKASRVPETVARCIDLSAEKATQLYQLLYELMENNKERNK